MRFLLDESVDYPLAALLEAMGHDVKAIAYDFPRSLVDREVLRIAVNERRILLTNDKDFGELVFRDQLPHAGVVLFRLGDEDLETKRQWLERLLRDYPDRLTEFVVVSDRAIRIRHYPGANDPAP